MSNGHSSKMPTKRALSACANLLLVLSALATAGCGVTRNETEAAGTFSKSAAAFTATLKTAYGQAPQDEADLRTARYVVNGGQYEKAQARGSIADLKGRLAAAEALASYGEALATLLDSKAQEADVSAATDKLTAALNKIPKTYVSLSTSKINSVGDVLKVVADSYLDYQRRQALEQIVPVMEPIVTNLCSKFGQDFDFRKNGFAEEYYDRADRIFDRVSSDVNLQQRAVIQPVLQRADAIRTKTSVTFASVSDAAKSCVQASQALKQAVENPTLSYEDILDFANKTEAAFSAVNAAIKVK